MLKIIRNIKCLQLFRPVLSGLNSRQISSREPEYVPVYRLPYIRVLGLVNRLKIYQTALTAAGIPSTLALSQANVVGFDVVLTTGVIGISGCIVLYSIGFLTNKFIGIVYLHRTEEKVKVSYLDFWGRRKDEVIPLDDIIPFSEAPVSFTDALFLNLRRFSTKDKLRINLRFGEVLHKRGFNRIFTEEV